MKYKKTGAFLLAFTMLFCTACGSSPNNNPASGSPPSSVQDSSIESKENTITFGDYRGNKWEYTAQKAIVYDHYNESGLPEDAFFEGVNDQKLVIVEVTIKKVEGPQRQNNEEYDTLEYLNLVNSRLREAQKGRTESPTLPDLVYFSGHEDGTGAYQYWLDPGEEAVFQLGWCLSDGKYDGRATNMVFLTDTEGLALCVGSGSNIAGYIDLTVEEGR